MTTPSLTLANLKPRLDKIAGRTGTAPVKKLTTASLWPWLDAMGKSPPAPSPFARNPDRADGWNPVWYARIRPDVVAVGVDLEWHWETYGRAEGMLAYEGADAEPPATLHDLILRPAPMIEIPDVYAEPGATEVVIRGRIVRSDGSIAERSCSLRLDPENVTGGGINIGDARPVDDLSAVLPTSGGTFARRMTIGANWTGFFKVSVFDRDAQRPRAECRVYCNTPRPADRPVVAIPEPTKARAPAIIRAYDFTTDFRADLAKDWQIGGGRINKMNGWWTEAGARRLDGSLIDPFPMIGDDRVMRPVDCRHSAYRSLDGLFEWALPKLVRASSGPYGVLVFDLWLPPRTPGLNLGAWGIKRGGAWPPEWDHLEHTEKRSTQTVHGFANETVATELAMIPAEGGRIELVVERDAQRLRQWVNGVAAVDQPNYLLDTVMDTTISIEGIGGDAASGGYDPTRDYSTFVPKLLGFKERWY